MSGRIKDLSGMRFGRLVIISLVGRAGHQTMWQCVCDCGNRHVASTSSLSRGSVKSCGCLVKDTNRKQFGTHGETKSRLYNIWDGIRRRCAGTKGEKNTRLYAARGISVCAEWSKYENFRDWSLENGYQDNLTIDRIDVNGDYCPENCRWATMKVQENNKRNNRFLTFGGETKTIGEWATEKDIPYDVLHGRVYLGWPLKKVFAEPIRIIKDGKCYYEKLA